MRYDRIINLPRPASCHPKMSAYDRAAQFSAFAALVGLDEQMDETARLVDSKIELSEDEIETLNRKIPLLLQKVNNSEDYPKIKVIYFVPDQRKNGGSYVTKIGAVKRVDDIFRQILFTDGTNLKISEMLDFELID
ncbi:MAG: hypothetical protein HDT13_00595 [Butyrivibrio sp.]|nr:hypothetical protein [Butyrivibrio sp.]